MDLRLVDHRYPSVIKLIPLLFIFDDRIIMASISITHMINNSFQLIPLLLLLTLLLHILAHINLEWKRVIMIKFFFLVGIVVIFEPFQSDD